MVARNIDAEAARRHVIERIGVIVAVFLVTGLFVAGVWAMEQEPPPGAPQGPAN